MSTSNKFKTAELLEMGMPFMPPKGGRIISDEISGTRRWSTDHHLIVQFADQMGTDDAWLFWYSVGSTEQQDERPWEYEDETTAQLVHRTTKTVEVWE